MMKEVAEPKKVGLIVDSGVVALLQNAKVTEQQDAKSPQVKLYVLDVRAIHYLPRCGLIQLRQYRTVKEMDIALFGIIMIALRESLLSGQEKMFFLAVNKQRSERVPFIHIDKMDLNDRRMWRSALAANFKGLQVLELLDTQSYVRLSMFVCTSSLR
jgi:hypothetical protein